MGDVRLIRGDELSSATAQTPGMLRRTAVDGPTAGARSLWVGVVTVEPGARTGAHHHGDCESVIYVTAGRILLRFGEHLEKDFEAGPGDFLFVPANLLHQEINPSDSEAVESIVIRDCGENVVVNVDIAQELLSEP